jgi:hypothetical protein
MKIRMKTLEWRQYWFEVRAAEFLFYLIGNCLVLAMTSSTGDLYVLSGQGLRTVYQALTSCSFRFIVLIHRVMQVDQFC